MNKGILGGALALSILGVCIGLSDRLAAAEGATCGSCAPAPAAGKKVIGAKLQIKADKVEVFVEAAKAIIAASRAEPGCISYTLYQDPYDKTAFFFFEEWKDQAAIDFHFATPHFKAFGDKLKDLTAGPPSIVIYDCPSEKKAGG